MNSRQSDGERIDSLMDKLDKMTESQLAANEASTLLRGQLSELMHLLKDKEDAYRLLQSEKEALAEQLKVTLKTMYGSKSQKGISRKKENQLSREEEKGHFDGSAGSISQVDEPSVENSSQAPSPSSPAKEIRMYRQGVEYRTMKAGKSVSHHSDMNKLPEDAKVFYKKKYLWCLVNKEAKIAIYCYEEGSRSRDALRLILGNAQVKSLQSDGYNVYMYLDNELIDVEHICCMAHARAKFKYALEQGGDKAAEYFLKCIGELYKLEAEYEDGKLSAEQIGLLRQKLKTKEIVIRLRSKLDSMLSANHPPRGELMEKALRYLDTFWTQLFAYLKERLLNMSMICSRTRFSSGFLEICY